MKPKSVRLKPVEQLAEDRAKTATQSMVRARDEHSSHEHKLKELQRYRSEYLEQFHDKGRTGIAANQLQQYQHFIAQIDKAIEQQRQMVKQAKMTLDDKQTHWKAKNSHKKAINKAVDKYRKQEQKHQDKREQQELDEHNTQSLYREKP